MCCRTLVSCVVCSERSFNCAAFFALIACDRQAISKSANLPKSRNSGISAWASGSLFCLEVISRKQTRLFRYSLDRAQREHELENLMRTLESESKSFEEQLQQARQKHTQQSDQFQDEIDQLKWVRQPCVLFLGGSLSFYEMSHFLVPESTETTRPK